MNVTLEDFIQTVDKGFFRHIRKETVCPIDERIDRVQFLTDLFTKLATGSYFVQSPRAFKVESKAQKTARVIPILEISDYCVYYYCIKKLEKELALNRVDSTYGGFSLNGLIRDQEVAEIDRVSEEFPSTPKRSYNTYGWVESWKDFTKKAYVHATESDASDFLFLDIANFYDTIDLDKLESKVRHATSDEQGVIVNILFSFLRNWNRKVYGYGVQTKGIPQDEVGDCSRILANFYLQKYDEQMAELCSRNGVKYFRYADDQILMSNSKDSNLRCLYEASIILHKEGLNINTSKVKEQDESQFTKYWAYEIYELLDDKDNREKVKEGVTLFIENLANGRDDFRWWAVLARIITCGIHDLPLAQKHKIAEECTRNDFLIEQSSRELSSIGDLMSDNERELYKDELLEMSRTARFNGFIYELIDLQRKKNIFSEDELTTLRLRLSEMTL